jgi:hypothetical protein
MRAGAGIDQPPGEPNGGALAAVIGVNHQLVAIQVAAPQRAHRRAEHQLDVGPNVGLPAHDPPGQRLVDDRQPQRPAPGWMRDRSTIRSPLAYLR